MSDSNTLDLDFYRLVVHSILNLYCTQNVPGFVSLKFIQFGDAL